MFDLLRLASELMQAWNNKLLEYSFLQEIVLSTFCSLQIKIWLQLFYKHNFVINY